MTIRLDRQITVALENQPGQLATVCRLLADAAINIDGIAVIDSIDQGAIRLMTSDPDKCRQVLGGAGFYVVEGEILVLDVKDKVGLLAQLTAALAAAKINIDFVYGTVEQLGTPMRLVLKASDLARARKIIEPLLGGSSGGDAR
jgi:hypothetical protein